MHKTHYPGFDRGRFTAYCNMLAKEGQKNDVNEPTVSPNYPKSGLGLTGMGIAGSSIKTPTRSFYVVNGSSL